MNKSEKIVIINTVLKNYFADQSNSRKVLAKDLMPEFIRAGAFAADKKNGLPIRSLLRDLDEANALSKIPYVLPERKEINTNWYFIDID